MAAPKRSPIVKSQHLASLIPALRSFCALLKKSKTKGIVIGGVASSLLGRPRLTADIDATVLLNDASVGRFLKQAAAENLVPRIANAAAFLQRSAMLLLIHQASGVAVDIAQGRLPFERKATSRAILVKVEDFTVPLPTPEDLIIMKALAHRPRDLEDIRGIVASQPRMNVARIRKELTAFAQVLDMPDLWKDISGIFEKRLKRKPRSARHK